MSKIKWSQKMIKRLLKLYYTHTYSEIAKKINKEFGLNITDNCARKAYERYRFPIMTKKDKSKTPKMLVIDIETSPLMARIWALHNNYVQLNQMDVDWHLMSFAAKWYDSDEIIYMDQRKKRDITNDKEMCKKLWKLLDEADIVITQNGKKFDTKKINARMLLNGIKTPPSSYRQIDTFLIARRQFGFTSNKLEYMTSKLCKKYKKLSHGKYPGNKLWEECLKGNMEAWDEMEKYNKYDILSLQELYDVLVPWDDRINFTVYFEEDRCSCGSTDFVKNGIYYTNANKYQRYKCKKCGKEYRDRKAIKTDKRFRTTNRRG